LAAPHAAVFVSDGSVSELERFVRAQGPVYEGVRQELLSGRKTTHWMWFVFPQLRGLGRSAMAHQYGIASMDEAVDYLKHPVLGSRLRECVGVVLATKGKSAHDIFGSPDDLKLRSCLTLFHAAAPTEPVFGDALQKFFNGEPDPRTLELIGSERNPR
jgi:uncharacterized protein (DUF1810 family)